MFKGLSLLAAHEMGGAVKRRAVAVAFYLGAALFAVIAFVFALNALHDWLIGAQFLTPMHANLVIAGGLSFVALVLVFIGISKRNGRPETSMATTAALVSAPLALRSLGRMNAGTLLALGVLVIGAIVGRQAAKS